jgi:hypothetical protein
MKKTLVCVAAIGLLACTCLTNGIIRPTVGIPPTGTLQPTRTLMPSETGTPTATTTPSKEPTETITPSKEPTATVDLGFTIVRVNPKDGDLNEQLAAEVAKAKNLGQDAYVEFDAAWCPCCQAIEDSLDEGNELMVDAFQGVYLVRADYDDWEKFLQGTGFEFDAIPIFYQLNDLGGPTGKWIDGDAWGKNNPENMAPVLKKFFQAH